MPNDRGPPTPRRCGLPDMLLVAAARADGRIACLYQAGARSASETIRLARFTTDDLAARDP